MPADTLNEMILGFAVILGILLTYVVILIIRAKKAKSRSKTIKKE
jgi:membrane-bound ClpP family serine protease